MAIKNLSLALTVGIIACGSMDAGWQAFRAACFNRLAKPFAGIASLRLALGNVSSQESDEKTRYPWSGVPQRGQQMFILHGTKKGNKPTSVDMILYGRDKYTEPYASACGASITADTHQSHLNILNNNMPTDINFPRPPIINKKGVLEFPINMTLEKCHLVRLVNEQSKTIGVSRDCGSFLNGYMYTPQGRLEFLNVSDVTLDHDGPSILHELPARKTTPQMPYKPYVREKSEEERRAEKFIAQKWQDLAEPETLGAQIRTMMRSINNPQLPCDYCRLVSEGVHDINLRNMSCTCSQESTHKKQ